MVSVEVVRHEMEATKWGDVSIQLGRSSRADAGGVNMTPSYINFSGRKTLAQAYQEEGSCNVCRFGDEMLKCYPGVLICLAQIDLFSL